MRLAVVTTAALIAMAGTGQAQSLSSPCALNGLAPAPVQDEIKSAFLAGQYETFYRLSTPLISDASERYAEIIGPLPTLVPTGFADCSTILRRRDEGGMTQEVSLFSLKPPGSGVIALLLVTAPVAGKEQVIFFSYNDKVTQVLSALH